MLYPYRILVSAEYPAQLYQSRFLMLVNAVFWYVFDAAFNLKIFCIILSKESFFQAGLNKQNSEAYTWDL